MCRITVHRYSGWPRRDCLLLGNEEEEAEWSHQLIKSDYCIIVRIVPPQWGGGGASDKITSIAPPRPSHGNRLTPSYSRNQLLIHIRFSYHIRYEME